MLNWSKKQKKLFTGLIISLLVFQFFVPNINNREIVNNQADNFFEVSDAEAIPVVDVFQAVLQTLWEFLSEAWTYIYEEVWPALRDMAAKKIIDYMVQETIGWINNGETPTFVGDWKQFQSDVTNIAFNTLTSYVNSTRGVNLCAPLAPQLTIKLEGLYRYYNGRYDNLPNGCSYDEFKYNLENSIKFIERGDWLSYDAMFSPDQNAYWVNLRVEDQFLRISEEEKTALTNEAQSSSGYLGGKQCTKYVDPDGFIVTESDIKTECERTLGTDSDQLELCVKELKTAWCKDKEITTPGDVNSKAVGAAVTSDIDWGANIQSWKSAIISALIGRVFKEGLSAISNNDSTSETGVVDDGGSLIAGWNNLKRQISGLYDDIVYYYNSNDYPTLQIFKDAQQLAQQGVSSCSDPAKYQQKYDEITFVINGLETMLFDAREGMNQLAEIDELLTQEQTQAVIKEINSKITQATSVYQNFSSTYANFQSEIAEAKQSGSLTATQQLAEKLKANLTSAIASAPSCDDALLEQ